MPQHSDNIAASTPLKSETRDGMRIDWDVPIEMDDGTVLRCDVFRPEGPGRYPVLLGAGPYAKWLSFQDEVSSPPPNQDRRILNRKSLPGKPPSRVRSI